MNVVPLENLSRVVVSQSGRCRARNVEKQIHTHREVCCINESRAVALDQLTHSIHLSMPTGSAHDHVLARADAGFDMADNARGDGEINHYVNVAQFFWGQSRAAGILRGAHGLNLVPAPAREFRHQRSRLSAAQKKNVHGTTFDAEIAEKCRGVR
jgi:hypothetical protein